MSSTFKKIYSPEEIAEIHRWLTDNRDKVPASLQLDQATEIIDLPQTMGHFIEIVECHRENPTYGAQIYAAFKLRDRIEALRKEESH